jgi:hypothetical protein
MTTPDERKPPSGDAWRDAQREVSERNEQARKLGREEKAAHERKLAALRRAGEAQRETFH